MFSTSKRFNDKVNDTPGPGEYNINASNPDKYKKYGFLHKSKRFGDGEKEEYGLGEYYEPSGPDSARKPPSRSSSSLSQHPGRSIDEMKYKREVERWKEKYEKQSLLHEKEIEQLEERSRKLELQYQHAIKEKNSIIGQVATKESEIQQLLIQQNHLKLNLEKTEKSAQSLLDKGPKTILLQKRIDDLEKQNSKLRGIADKADKSKEKIVSEQTALKTTITSIKAELEQKALELERTRVEMVKVCDQNKKEKDSLTMERDQLIQMHSNEIDEIRQMLNSANGELKVMQSELQQQNEVIDLLKVEKKETEKLIEQLKSNHAHEIVRLQRTLDEVQQDLLEEKENLVKLQADHGEQISRLKKNLEASRQKVTEEAEKINRLEIEHNKAVHSLEQMLEKAHKDFIEEKKGWEDERSSLCQEKCELSERLVIIELAQKELQELKEQLVQDKVSLEKEFQEKRNSYESQIESLGQSLTEATRLYDELNISRTKQNTEFQVQMRWLEDQLVESQSLTEANKSKLLEEIEGLNDTVKQLTMELDGQVIRYTQDISSRDIQIKSLREELQSIEFNYSQNRVTWTEEKQVLEQRISELESIKLRLDLAIGDLQQQMRQEQSTQVELINNLEQKLQVEIDGRRRDCESWTQERRSLTHKHQEEINHLQELHDKLLEDFEKNNTQQLATIVQLETRADEETQAHAKFQQQIASDKEALVFEYSQKVESIRVAHDREINDLQLAISNLQAIIEDTYGKLEKSTESFNEKRQDLEKSVQALELDLAATHETIEKKSTEFNSQIAIKNSEIQMLQNELQEAENRYEEESKSLQTSINDLHQQLKEKTSSITSLQEEVRRLQCTIVEANLDLETIRKSSTKRIAGLKSTIEEISQEYEEYRHTKSSVIEELNHTIERVNTELERQHESSTSRINELYAKIDRVSRERGEYCDSKAIEVTQLTHTVNSVNKELAQEKESHSNLVNILQSSIQNAKQEFQLYRESSMQEIEELNQELQQANEGLVEMQNSLKYEIEARDEHIQLLVSDLKNQYFQRNEMDQQKAARIQELNTEINKRDFQLLLLEYEANNLKEELCAHKQQSNSLNDVLESIAFSFQNHQADDFQEIISLSSQTQSLNNELSLLRQDYNTIHNDTQIQKDIFEHLISINSQLSISSQFRHQLETSVALSLLSKMSEEFEEERRQIKEEADRDKTTILATNEAQAQRIKELEAKITQANEQSQAHVKASAQLLEQQLEQTERELSRKEREIASLNRRIGQDMSSWLLERKRLAQIANNAEAEVEKLMLEVDKLRCKANAADNARMEIEEQMQLQSQFLAQKHSMAFDELAKLSGQNAKLLGHNNSKQKIKHITQLKEENIVLKKENLTLLKARDQFKIKVMRLERDLEAYQSVTTNNGKVIRSRTERTTRNGVISPPLDLIEETMSTVVSDHSEY